MPGRAAPEPCSAHAPKCQPGNILRCAPQCAKFLQCARDQASCCQLSTRMDEPCGENRFKLLDAIMIRQCLDLATPCFRSQTRGGRKGGATPRARGSHLDHPLGGGREMVEMVEMGALGRRYWTASQATGTATAANSRRAARTGLSSSGLVDMDVMRSRALLLPRCVKWSLMMFHCMAK